MILRILNSKILGHLPFLILRRYLFGSLILPFRPAVIARMPKRQCAAITYWIEGASSGILAGTVGYSGSGLASGDGSFCVIETKSLNWWTLSHAERLSKFPKLMGHGAFGSQKSTAITVGRIFDEIAVMTLLPPSL